MGRRSGCGRAAVRWRWTLLITLLAILYSEPAIGQRRSNWDILKRELDWAGDDVVHIWGAPFRTQSDDLLPLLAFTAPGVLIGAFDEPIQRWFVEREGLYPVRLLTPFRQGGPLNRVGRTYVQVPLSVVLYTAGLISDDPDLRDAGVGCATANLSTTLPRATFSRFVGRQRPRAEEGAYAFKPFTFNDWDSYSFPGGHVSNIMSCASFWSHRFELGAAEPLLYLLAVGVGLGRVADGAHWTSDTFYGLAIGWAVGRLVADRISDRRAADAAAQLQPAQVPIYIGWRIAF